MYIYTYLNSFRSNFMKNFVTSETRGSNSSGHYLTHGSVDIKQSFSRPKSYLTTWLWARCQCLQWGHRFWTPQGGPAERGSTGCPGWDSPASGAAQERKPSDWLQAWSHPTGVEKETQDISERNFNNRPIETYFTKNINIIQLSNKKRRLLKSPSRQIPCRWCKRRYLQLWRGDHLESWSIEPHEHEGGSSCQGSPEGLWSEPGEKIIVK